MRKRPVLLGMVDGVGMCNSGDAVHVPEGPRTVALWVELAYFSLLSARWHASTALLGLQAGPSKIKA